MKNLKLSICASLLIGSTFIVTANAAPSDFDSTAPFSTYLTNNSPDTQITLNYQICISPIADVPIYQCDPTVSVKIDPKSTQKVTLPVPALGSYNAILVTSTIIGKTKYNYRGNCVLAGPIAGDIDSPSNTLEISANGSKMVCTPK